MLIFCLSFADVSSTEEKDKTLQTQIEQLKRYIIIYAPITIICIY